MDMSTTTTMTATATATTTISVVETVHGTEKKPRSTQQWEEIARSNTQRVTQMGANVPLAWGKNIPQNAIIAGEDKRRPLYIARTFWEHCAPVLSDIGQAALHLERGASFAYNGREIHVDTYEVLIPLQQTITYHVADNYHIPSIPRITRQAESLVENSFAVQLRQKLREIKVVMVIDDSISVLKLSKELMLLANVDGGSSVESSSIYIETNGIDLYFLNNVASEVNVRNRQRIESLFDSVYPQGATPTGQKLHELFSRYLPHVENPNSGSPPIVVMLRFALLADNVEGVIIEGARRLDRNHVPQYRFGLSFVQIGNDPDAAEFLRELDDDISAQHNCRDMVNATPYDPSSPEFTRDVFLKCVLGSIDPFYDNLLPHLPAQRASPVAPKPATPAPSTDFGYPASVYIGANASVSPGLGMHSPLPPPLHPNSQFMYPVPVPMTN
ncbi:hypothetical protein D9756_006123 [Leucocoprinus leucothites]|uniref:Uncharacterized protein n=1 Tax=Leucocoprinus leucothites TaxID=201217 RepID=A0A8H5FXY7_9AGAR|nr:hypothetical protein D9756_006123 [Leucoagaricus leucothites]